MGEGVTIIKKVRQRNVSTLKNQEWQKQKT